MAHHKNLLFFFTLRHPKNISDTPALTPTYKYNSWANQKKSFGVTPRLSYGKGS